MLPTSRSELERAQLDDPAGHGEDDGQPQEGEQVARPGSMRGAARLRSGPAPGAGERPRSAALMRGRLGQRRARRLASGRRAFAEDLGRSPAVAELGGGPLNTSPPAAEPEDPVGIAAGVVHVVQGGDHGETGARWRCAAACPSRCGRSATSRLATGSSARITPRAPGRGSWRWPPAAARRPTACRRAARPCRPGPRGRRQRRATPRSAGSNQPASAAHRRQPRRWRQAADQDVVDDAQPLHEIELLVDHPDARAVLAQAPGRAAAARSTSSKRIAPADGGGRAARQRSRVVLPGPGAADDRDELAGVDGGGDVVERALASEGLGDPVDADDGRADRCHVAGHRSGAALPVDDTRVKAARHPARSTAHAGTAARGVSPRWTAARRRSSGSLVTRGTLC